MEEFYVYTVGVGGSNPSSPIGDNRMPRYRKFCKNGEEPTRFIQGQEFEDVFGVKTYRHPSQGVNRSNYYYSHVPEEWVPAIKRLVDKISNIYGLIDGVYSDNGRVQIVQIKDKFGVLCFYYYTDSKNKSVRDKIDTWISATMEELKLDDPYYGKPY